MQVKDSQSSVIDLVGSIPFQELARYEILFSIKTGYVDKFGLGIAGHGGWPWMESMIGVALRNPNIPWLRELEPQRVWINSADADARGIKDGDMVRVFNNRGVTVLPAKVTQRIMPGVVDVPEGAWYDPDENGMDRGGCSNVLTGDEYSPGGAYPTNTSLVQVEKP